MRLPDEVYNILKWVCLIVLPAIGVALGGLGMIWGHDMTRLVETIGVLDTFLGALLGVSCYNYNKEQD